MIGWVEGLYNLEKVMLSEGYCDLIGVGARGGYVSYFNYTLAFALQMREITENLSECLKSSSHNKFG
jgi:hypothetical protein